MKNIPLLCSFAVATALTLPSLAFGAEPHRHNEAGTRTGALDNNAWQHSQWISVADAPVIRGSIEGNNVLAADGAAWFVTEFKNDKKIASARWMTSGLGVYNLYVNGKSIGAEVLKPGFTLCQDQTLLYIQCHRCPQHRSRRQKHLVGAGNSRLVGR